MSNVIDNFGIKYKEIDDEEYKYELIETYSIQTNIITSERAIDGYVVLDKSGLLTIKKRYWWDGPDYAPDIESMMRASLVHDALYQLLRSAELDIKWRDSSDILFRDICIADGLNRFLANAALWLLRKYGDSHADPR